MNLYPYFSQHVLYPLYEKTAGRHFLEKLALLKQSQWWDSETLKAYQWKKIKKLLFYAFNNNSFYRKRFNDFNLDPGQIQDFVDFTKIPILSKSDIVNHLPELISEGHSPRTLVRDNTSGSTGRNLIFYNDRNTLDWMTAAVLRHMAWYNVYVGDNRVILWGSLASASAKERVYMACRNILLRERIISSYELNTDKLASIVRLLKKTKPNALIGYVSALNILGDFIDQNGISDVG